MIRPRHALAAVAAAGLVAASLSGCGNSSASAKSSGTTLTGLLSVNAGACKGAQPTGSYFRMVTPTGQVGKGPYVTNADSTCKDKSVTLLHAGTDGGLKLGAYQPEATPAFANSGDSASAAILRPVSFFAVKFGVATNPKDPQSGAKVPAPTATLDGNTLTVDLSSWSVGWNHQEFNQGAPKPAASGAQATGTVNSAGTYTLEWFSKIKGGPFNGFTGVWHLTGTLQKA